jgi:hypothetical protein
MNETQRTQLDVLNQKVVDGEELNELQKQLRSELSALQQQTGNSFADLRRLFHTLSQIYYSWLDFAHIDLIEFLCFVNVTFYFNYNNPSYSTASHIS